MNEIFISMSKALIFIPFEKERNSSMTNRADRQNENKSSESQADSLSVMRRKKWRNWSFSRSMVCPAWASQWRERESEREEKSFQEQKLDRRHSHTFNSSSRHFKSSLLNQLDRFNQFECVCVLIISNRSFYNRSITKMILLNYLLDSGWLVKMKLMMMVVVVINQETCFRDFFLVKFWTKQTRRYRVGLINWFTIIINFVLQQQHSPSLILKSN